MDRGSASRIELTLIGQGGGLAVDPEHCNGGLHGLICMRRRWCGVRDSDRIDKLELMELEVRSTSIGRFEMRVGTANRYRCPCHSCWLDDVLVGTARGSIGCTGRFALLAGLMIVDSFDCGPPRDSVRS